MVRRGVCVQVMEQCAGLLESVCRRSSLRAAKTVRAQMTSMAALLAADPQLTVIHLLRDPRAVVASRRLGDTSMIGKHSITARTRTETARREAVIYCRTAVRDIRARQALEARYTDVVVLETTVCRNVQFYTKSINQSINNRLIDKMT